MIKAFYIGLALLVSPIFVSAQTGLCGTPPPPKSTMDFIRGLDFSVSGTEDSTIINIPVTIHIIRTSNGGGGFTEVNAYATICDLNNRMAPAGMFFYVPEPVNFILDDDYYTAPDYGPLFNMIDFNNVPRTVNIYYTNLSQIGLCGFAFYPNSGPGGFQNDGAVVMGFACSQPTGTTLTHEIGHFFNLPHTFDQTSSNPTSTNAELVTRNFNEPSPRLSANCNNAGDGFCDTPADFIGTRWSCPNARIQLDANGDRFFPDSSYYMSYSNDQCMSRFSAQQITTMRATLANVNASRGYLLINPMPAYPPLTSAPEQLTPAANDTLIPNQAVFSWRSVPGATLYQIRILLFNFSVVDTITTDTFYVNRTRSIRPNRDHSWEVRAIHGAQLCTNFGPRIVFSSTNLALSSSALELSKMTFFPNPITAGEALQIRLSGAEAECQVRLFNLQGQLLVADQLVLTEGSGEWLLPELSPGIYLFELSNANGQRSRQRLVVR